MLQTEFRTIFCAKPEDIFRRYNAGHPEKEGVKDSGGKDRDFRRANEVTKLAGCS
jgi:hypothetical protein